MSTPLLTPVAGGVAEKAREALHHYHQALEHLKSGDWAGFGAQLDVMRATLETLNRAAGDR